MPGKKGMHWSKGRVEIKKMSIYLSETTANKIELLSKLIKKAKEGKDRSELELERETPSGIASQIIEKNTDNYMQEVVEILDGILHNGVKKGQRQQAKSK